MSENTVQNPVENPVSGRNAPQPSTASSPLHPLRRLLPMLALAATFVLALWMVLPKNSPLYALITPPHTPDFTATGEGPLQQFGFSVASAGDINDDGFGDVIVGANNLNNAIFVYEGSA